MLVTHKAKMAGYHKNIYFSKRAITNIIALRNIIHQYQVYYDSDDKMFIVHRESEENRIWSSECIRSGYITTTRATKFLHSLTLSLEKRKVTLRDKPRAHKLLGICKLIYATHTGKTSSRRSEAIR